MRVTQGIVNLTAEGRNETASHNPLCTHDVLPNLKRLSPQQTVIDRLHQDAQRLFSILELAGDWKPATDEKLTELQNLLTKKHPNDKVIRAYADNCPTYQM